MKTTVLLLADFDYGGRRFRFQEPVRVAVFEDDDKGFSVSDDDLGVFACGDTVEDLLDDIHEEIHNVWAEVAQSDDAALNSQMKRVKSYIGRVLRA